MKIISTQPQNQIVIQNKYLLKYHNSRVYLLLLLDSSELDFYLINSFGNEINFYFVITVTLLFLVLLSSEG